MQLFDKNSFKTDCFHQNYLPVQFLGFLAHVDEGFYANTIFHRIIDNFMVQGGGFDDDEGGVRQGECCGFEDDCVRELMLIRFENRKS